MQRRGLAGNKRLLSELFFSGNLNLGVNKPVGENLEEGEKVVNRAQRSQEALARSK